MGFGRRATGLLFSFGLSGLLDSDQICFCHFSSVSSANSSTTQDASSVLRSRRQTSETSSVASSGRNSSPQPTLRRSARLQTSAVKENKTMLNKKRDDFDSSGGASDVKPSRKDRLGGNSQNIKSENIIFANSENGETFHQIFPAYENNGKKRFTFHFLSTFFMIHLISKKLVTA